MLQRIISLSCLTVWAVLTIHAQSDPVAEGSTFTSTATTAPATAKPRLLTPTGDFKLPRLGKTSFCFQGFAKGDTLKFNLTTKAGQSPRSIILFNPANHELHPAQIDPSYKKTTVIDTTDTFKLEVKGRFKLRRLQSHLEVYHHPLVADKTGEEATKPHIRFDTLITPLPGGGTDTLINKYFVDGDGEELLGQRRISVDSLGNRTQSEAEQHIRIHPQKRRKLNPSGTFELKRLGETVFTYPGLNTGDTVLIEVKTPDQSPVARYRVTDNHGRELNRVLDQPMIFDTIIIQDQDTIWLNLKSKLQAPGKQAVEVNVNLLPYAPRDTFYQITDSLYTTRDTIAYDTTLLSVADDLLLIAPTWNIEGRSKQLLDITVPMRTDEGGRFMFLAYWIVIGQPALRAYSALEAEVPADWVQPGVPLAVGAYGLDYPINLPVFVPKDLPYYLLNQTQKRKWLTEGSGGSIYDFLQNRRGQTFRRNFGILKLNDLRGSAIQYNETSGLQQRRFLFYLENKNTINTYPVQVKMVAYYRLTTYQGTITEFASTRTYEQSSL